jgi:hypothetical protein
MSTQTAAELHLSSSEALRLWQAPPAATAAAAVLLLGTGCVMLLDAHLVLVPEQALHL